MLGYMLGRAMAEPAVVHVPDRSLASAEDRMFAARVDALELAFAGLWRLLKAQGFTDDHLIRAMQEADLSDGVKDGKVKAHRGACQACGHKLLSRQSQKCLWCGADLPVSALG